MSERQTHPQASSATEPAARRPDERGHAASSRSAVATGLDAGAVRGTSGGQSLATRAARFRNGAPFLVERATLYDPYPLDPLPLVEMKTLPRQRPRSLLPAALTLLGVVVVVGLAAGVLFVRNAEGPRHSEEANRVAPSGEPDGRRSGQRGGPQGGIAYDLTRRPNDAITGAWRLSKELGKQVERAPTPSTRMSEPSPAAGPSTPEAPRRLLPQRLTLPRTAPTNEQLGEPNPPSRAPLDEPHVPKAITEDVPKAVVEVEPSPSRTTGSEPPVRLHQPPKQANDRPGANVVARVGREADGPDVDVDRRRRSGMPVHPREHGAGASKSGKGGRLSRRALREQQRQMRKAAREAQDLDRFLLRNAGDIPKGFIFSGPQGQKP